MRIALELAAHNSNYESAAIRFLEHFLQIARSMSQLVADSGLWDEEEGFYFDVLVVDDGKKRIPVKTRSLVGLIPMYAVEVIEPETLKKLPRFASHVRNLMKTRKDLEGILVSDGVPNGVPTKIMLSVLPADRLKRVLQRMLDPNEFL